MSGTVTTTGGDVGTGTSEGEVGRVITVVGGVTMPMVSAASPGWANAPGTNVMMVAAETVAAVRMRVFMVKPFRAFPFPPKGFGSPDH